MAPPGYGARRRDKLKEADCDLNRPEDWGFGEFIFTPFHAGTMQYDWLRQVLASDAAQEARYRVVMAHQSVHGLGDNALPADVDPVMDDMSRVEAPLKPATDALMLDTTEMSVDQALERAAAAVCPVS